MTCLSSISIRQSKGVGRCVCVWGVSSAMPCSSHLVLCCLLRSPCMMHGSTPPPPTQEQRLHSAPPASCCQVCRTDLWLSAVTSSAAPGQAVCPEHVEALAAPAATCTLLFRHSIEELQRLVFEAVALFPGGADDIRSAQQRLRTRPSMRGIKSLGPLVQREGETVPPPRAPELKAGGREPATPVAGGLGGKGWVPGQGSGWGCFWVLWFGVLLLLCLERVTGPRHIAAGDCVQVNLFT